MLVGALAAALVLAGVLGVQAGGGGAAQTPAIAAPTPSSQASPASATSSPLVWPADLIWPSDRTFKADQIEKLGYAPEVIFFGGSRSRRLEPSYLEAKTGLKGFNLAMTNAKPEDAWAFAHFLHERSPDTHVRWVWGVHVSTLMERELEPGLIQDARLSRYLPADLLREQAGRLPTSPDEVPEVGRAMRSVYAPDGVVLWDSYDRAEARGLTLAGALRKDIPQHIRRLKATPTTIGRRASRSIDYLEATLGYLDQVGDEVVLVAMPLHPRVLRAVRAQGWQIRHNSLLAYLTSLRGRYTFEFVDLTELASFGGDRRDFYDAIHMKSANSGRLIDKLVLEFPEVFARER